MDTPVGAVAPTFPRPLKTSISLASVRDRGFGRAEKRAAPPTPVQHALGTQHAHAPGMHAVAFSLHRADQRMLALQRALLAPFGITPARYLMMLVLFRVGMGEMRMLRQSDLRRELG